MKLRPVKLQSFRTQTAVIYGGLAVALAATLSGVFGMQLAAQSRADEGLALHVVAKNVAHTLASGLEDRRSQVDRIANFTELWAHGLESDAVKHVLERTQLSDTHTAWAGVADVNGTVRVATGGLLVGASVAERPWFKEGLVRSHVGDVHGAKLLANLLPGTLTGEPRRFVDFSAPIVSAGKVVGVLGRHGSWEWARSVIDSMVPNNAGALQLDVFIFNREGDAIYAPPGVPLNSVRLPTDAVRASSPGVQHVGGAVVTTWSGGSSFLTASAPMESMSMAGDLGWTIVAREPTEVAFAPARRAFVYALAMGAFGAALAVLLAWLFSSMLSRPLAVIARAARDVEAGVDGATIPTFRNNQEVAQLSDALSGMTRRLVANNLELEARVRERTAELEAANAELQKLARHDPLTGLMNRRAYDERMDIALAASKRAGTPVSMLMVDADHFKSINDTFGHDIGDVVLKHLGSLLHLRLRETDSVARMGGEEFAVLLPNTDEAGAMNVAQAIVDRVASTPFTQVGRVTVSVGVATVLASSDAGEKLMRCADQALYSAKNAGRNRAHAYRAALKLVTQAAQA